MKKLNKILSIAILLSTCLSVSITGTTLAQQDEEYFFSLYLFVPGENVQIPEVLVTQLAQIGIKLIIETGDFGIWMDRAGKLPATHVDGGFDTYVLSFGFGTDPDIIYILYHSTAVRPHGWNTFAYDSGLTDTYLDEGRKQMNFTARQQAYWNLMELHQDDPPLTPINWPKSNLVTTANLMFYDPYICAGLRRAETFRFDPPTKDTFVYATDMEHKHMNPIFAMEGGSNQFVNLVFDTLVRLDKDKNIVPHIAESWTSSEDGLTWTFKIRDDIYWHDGEKFTAEDIEFTFNSIKVEEVGSVWIGIVEPYDTVTAIDDYTIELKFAEPYGPGILQLTEGPSFIPKHIFEGVPFEDWTTHPFSSEHPIGTGPYKFVEWKPDEYTHFEANENYFQGAPAIKNFYYKVIPDKATALVALENGEVDHAGYSWTIDEYEHIKTISSLKIHQFNTFSVGICLCFNTGHPLLSNKFVRQAIANAIPREQICKEIQGEHIAEPANQIFPPGWPWHNPNLPPIEYNIEKAKELMEMAGYNYDWITPEPPAPWTANLLPIATGVIIGLVVGVVGMWAIKREKYV